MPIDYQKSISDEGQMKPIHDKHPSLMAHRGQATTPNAQNVLPENLAMPIMMQPEADPLAMESDWSISPPQDQLSQSSGEYEFTTC